MQQRKADEPAVGPGQAQYPQHSAAAGFDSHLVKPVGIEALAKAIRPAAMPE